MEEKEVGKVAHYFGKVSVAMVELSDSLKIGDKVRIKGANTDFTQDVSSMQVERVAVTEAKAGEKVGLAVIQKAHEHDVVYRITG